jgi:hypothetical protein
MAAANLTGKSLPENFATHVMDLELDIEAGTFTSETVNK